MKILRVNMDKLEARAEELADEYILAGNRALVAKIMLNEVPATCHPLSASNKLILANGPLVGTGVPTSGRLSVGGKSPLTGGIKESNSGGILAGRLASHEIRAVVVEGKPMDHEFYTLVVHPDRAEVEASPELRGLGNYEVHARLRQKFGPEAALASIGPAGEARLLTAAVLSSDMQGLPGAVCARGALGALMGAKGLKAIVVPRKGRYRIPIRRRDRFRQALRAYHEVIARTPQTSEIYPKYGTAAAVLALDKMGGLPTLNFRRGHFDQAERISGQALYELITQRGGEGATTIGCMPGCTIRCYNKYPDRDGKLVVSPIQYETMAMLGSNLGIADLDTIARLNYLCNDVGVDTVELGVALGLLMDEGLIEFGDGSRVEQLVQGIARKEMLSVLLASGCVVTGKVFGIERIPEAKGQGLPAHEPRAVKGMGVTFSTTPMGADHTTGVTFREPVNHQKPEGQVQASLNAQVRTAGYDALGLCFFVATAVGPEPKLTVDLVNAVYGTDYDERLITDLGKDVMKTERAFNLAAGFNKVHDRIPDFFRTEKLPPLNSVCDVPQEEIDQFWEELERL